MSLFQCKYAIIIVHVSKAALEEARSDAAAATEKAVAEADSAVEAAAVSGELATTKEELETSRKSLVELEGRIEKAEQALADKVGRVVAYSKLFCFRCRPVCSTLCLAREGFFALLVCSLRLSICSGCTALSTLWIVRSVARICTVSRIILHHLGTRSGCFSQIG